ncbi:nuclear transport factor 2 family protein [Algoriphagus marinus]|uniref:nuclear transport factor 2 family protein n=1 Tax=Algoriphagus marinus TaxID=1925762 RepID=UPI00094B8FD5|nr:nuclear transport factor 2 family protein [Algoriphagus marinus]
MKKLLFLLLILGTFKTTFAQQNTLSDEAQIQNLIQESFDTLFSTFNADAIESYYTKDFILLEDGEIWDNEIIKNYFNGAIKKQPIPTRVNKFEFIKTEVNGNMAWIAYDNYATISRNGEIIRENHWIESAVAIKTSDGWRLKMLHSTPAKKE